MTVAQKLSPDGAFATINRGFSSVFRPQRLSIGLVVPIESYDTSPVPTMTRHVERVQLAEDLGFAAVWLRDVPFNVPSFGDAGQIFDPFVYLGLLAGATRRIALGTASIILPLRHPAHVAKAAASADVLSGGRLILGVASGDRPQEYPAMNADFHQRDARFRDSLTYVRRIAEHNPNVENPLGRVSDMDLLPKPSGARLPILVTGGSQQSPDWIAEHADGWMTYPRGTVDQARVIADWRARIGPDQPSKPVMQPLYIDLLPNDDAPPQPLHLGFRSGLGPLKSYLKSLEKIGVNHVALNLRFNRADTEHTLQRLASGLLPEFVT